MMVWERRVVDGREKWMARQGDNIYHIHPGAAGYTLRHQKTGDTTTDLVGVFHNEAFAKDAAIDHANKRVRVINMGRPRKR